jgi:hypothetical protein
MIESYHFGSMTVRGETHRNDLKIIGDQVIDNWWRQEAHAVNIADIHDILAAGVEILVVGSGDPGRMQVTAEAARAIADKGIKLLCLPTREAVNVFNSLHAKGARAAAAFHLTC